MQSNSQPPTDFDQYKKEILVPIKENALQQENERFKEKMEEITQDGKDLIKSIYDFRSQIITLEGVIFTAIIVFISNNSTLWLLSALISLVISMLFGIWSQNYLLTQKSGVIALIM